MASPGADSCPVRKTVAFGEEGSEEVYFADVWDRTPAEPARKLTYQDLLELKEIQRSLPRATQLDDPISGKPASHFLREVPIGLLPLLSEASVPSSQESSAASSPVVSPSPTPSGSATPPWMSLSPSRPKPPSVASTPWVPSHLAHLAPKKPPPQRQKPTFAFLPLLDTPPSSEAPSPYTSRPSSRSSSPDPEVHSDTDHSHDPPTPSLTNASLDSSPLSRASSVSPEPSFLQLPILRGKGGDHDHHLAPHSYERDYSHDIDVDLSDVLSSSMSSLKIRHSRSVSPPPPSRTTAWHAFPARDRTPQPSVSPQRSDASSRTSSRNPSPARRRNVMILNGVEIDLDDDEDDDAHTPASSTPDACRSPCAAGPTPLRPCMSPPSASTPTHLSPELTRERQLPSTPTLSCSPVPSSPPGRCTKSLCSPIRFQRDRNAVLTQSGYQHKIGSQGRATP
ncbi:hypothetical protein LshimejAT787_1302080 [Lyophyllum shimeji]|uniref:Uncharacterized protein n=1 Tax=Lyophyllum shimeji TaxID=47721 RepID=A0A9P3PY02_LYOSH|nr:hypothetical protein LshimejAT787_1302080 [Lyophyllum shimeji]